MNPPGYSEEEEDDDDSSEEEDDDEEDDQAAPLEGYVSNRFAKINRETHKMWEILL